MLEFLLVGTDNLADSPLRDLVVCRYGCKRFSLVSIPDYRMMVFRDLDSEVWRLAFSIDSFVNPNLVDVLHIVYGGPGDAQEQSDLLLCIAAISKSSYQRNL